MDRLLQVSNYTKYNLDNETREDTALHSSVQKPVSRKLIGEYRQKFYSRLFELGMRWCNSDTAAFETVNYRPPYFVHSKKRKSKKTTKAPAELFFDPLEDWSLF